MKPRIPKAPLQHTRKPREDYWKHRTFIRGLPCCVCRFSGTTQVHHLLRADKRPKGMGRRNADRYAIPLCARHHLATYGPDSAHGHGNDEEWLADKGIDGRDLAAALWRVTGDVDKGMRIVERARKVEARRWKL